MDSCTNRGRRSLKLSAKFGAILALAVATSLSVAAPPKVNSWFPPGANRGQTVVVTAAGEFPQWPIQVWCDTPGISFAPESDKGKWKVQVDASVPPGAAWVRLYDNEGASSIRPFIVGTIPEVEEVEPNDGLDKAAVLGLPVTVNGRLAKSGDVDCFVLELKRGQTIVAAVQAHQLLGSPMDGVLQLAELNSRGEAIVLRQEDDAVGLDPRIVYPIARDGKYVVRLFAFPAGTDSTIGFAGADTFIYRLTMTVGGFIDHTWPLAATRGISTPLSLVGWNLIDGQNSIIYDYGKSTPREQALGWFSAWQAGSAGTGAVAIVDAPSQVATEASEVESADVIRTLPIAISGCVDHPGDSDRFTFEAATGQKIRWRVDSASLGFLLDSQLAIQDAQGKVVAENDDSGNQRDAEIVFSAPDAGRYQVVVSDVFRHGGPRYLYRLNGAELSPDFALAVGFDAITVSAEKPTELIVTVDRKDGFVAPLEVRCEGLPAGVSASIAMSMPEGETAKSVKINLTVDAGVAVASGNIPDRRPFHVVGSSSSTPVLARTATFAVPGSNRLPDLWLTIKRPP